jgi:ribonuclease P protein component
LTKRFYETPVSAIENPPQTAARLSQPQLDQERPRHFAQSPPRGSQAPYAGLIFVNAPLPLRFGPEQRVKLGRDFQRTKTQGRRIVNGCLILNWVENAKSATPRLGVITSRKIGGAVVRTRARRLLREVFRRNQHRVARGVDVILVARNSIVEKRCGEVERDFVEALRRGGLVKKDESGATSDHV